MDAVGMESSKADNPSYYIKEKEEEKADKDEPVSEEEADEKLDPDRFFCIALKYDHDQEDRIREEFRLYHQDVIKYEGFHIKNRPSVPFFGEIVELSFDDDADSQVALGHTEFAIDKHNERNGTDLKLVEIKRANATLQRDIICYLTFDAEDSSSSDQTKTTYQAEVHKRFITPRFGRVLKKFRKEELVD